MKVSLTRREKFLLLALVYIGLFYLIVQLALIPMYTAYHEKVLQRDALKQEQERINFRIAMEESFLRDNETQNQRLEEIISLYPAVQRNEQIDNVLTGLCTDCGLEPMGLNMSAITKAPLLSKEGEAESFYVVTAKMVVNGNINQLIRLLNRIEPMDYIQLSYLSFGNDANQDLIQSRSITLQFEFIMFDQKAE